MEVLLTGVTFGGVGSGAGAGVSFFLGPSWKKHS